jgi:hypothetical protein
VIGNQQQRKTSFGAFLLNPKFNPMASQEHNMQEDAASALTNLQKSNETSQGNNGFIIPQRFTKSGRKKAVPFPLKVRIGLFDWFEHSFFHDPVDHLHYFLLYSTLSLSLVLCVRS